MEIKGREFPELRLDIEKTGEDDTSGTEDELFSQQGGSDSDGSKMTTESVHQAIEKYVERICRKWKGDLSFVGTYQEVMSSFQFFKTLYSTSTSSYRGEAIEHLGKKWRVEKSKTLKGSIAENVRIVNLVIKCKKTIDITQKPVSETTSSKQNTLRGEQNKAYLASISQGDLMSPQLLPGGTPYSSANNRMRRNSHSKENLPNYDPGVVATPLTPQQGAMVHENLVPVLNAPPPPRNPQAAAKYAVDGNGAQSESQPNDEATPAPQ